MSKLVPTEAFNRRIADLIAKDGSGAGLNGDPTNVRLTTNEFSPSPTLVVGGLEFAAFVGSDQISIGTGEQLVVRKPDDSAWGVGGRAATALYWVCSEAPAVPEVITGYAIIDSNEELIMACRFSDPITIRRIGDYVSVTPIFGFLSPQPFLTSE